MVTEHSSEKIDRVLIGNTEAESSAEAAVDHDENTQKVEEPSVRRTFWKNLADLIKVKTILTLMLGVIFCYLAVVGRLEASDFMTIFLMVVSFYFGTQQNK